MQRPAAHYFDARPEAASAPRRVPITLGDVSFELTTDTGVFSADHLDSGTRVLLDCAPPPPARGHVADIGCGYGPIAITCAMRSPGSRVLAIDVNARARELTRANAAALGLRNVEVHTPDDVPCDIRFAAIYSNPPIRIGKAALHELLVRWVDRLDVEGCAFLVVQRHLGSDSLADWLNREGFTTTRIASKASFRVLRVRPRGPA
jgi:16S rRNA (guanine1207-N2)-methyltransferase